MRAETFRAKPEPVTAMLFQGWSSAIDIMEWLNNIYLVPRGAGHYLRKEFEFRTFGDVKPEAKEFLVLNEGNGKTVRIDVGSYLVRYRNGSVGWFREKDFLESFEKVTNE